MAPFTVLWLQDISSQAKEHWWTEESLAGNMGLAAAGLNQQSHTELHTGLRSCMKAGVDISNVLWRKLFNNVEHWTYTSDRPA